MGQESSKPAAPAPSEVLQAPSAPASPLIESRTSRPTMSTPKPKATGWLTPKANKTSAPANVRRPATCDGTGRSGTVPRPNTGITKNRCSVPGQETVEEEEPEMTAVQKRQVKKEEAKEELVGRLNNIIKTTTAKLPEALTSKHPRAALMPASYQASEAANINWRGKLGSSKAEALCRMKDHVPLQPYLPPLTQENISQKVESSLGETMETFKDFQGAVHSFIEKGLPEEALKEFLFNEESEKQLTTYEKWSVVRNAAEQVLQVYANRANANWIEAEEWGPPSVIGKDSSMASVYAGSLDAALNQGQVALFLIDDGRLCETGRGTVAPLLSMDLWQAIKELAPHKVPSAQRLERLSYMGRHLLHAAVSIEMLYGANALKKLKIVLGVDCEQEHFMVTQLQQWGFFNLLPENVAVLPLPRFHGFAEDPLTGRLAHVKGSPKLMLGSGYATFLLNSPAEAYTLNPDMEPKCLSGSVLEWLKDTNANWLMASLFCDVDRLRPNALFDTEFLAAAMYAVERGGANMAMEVQLCDEERDMRTYDSVILNRTATSAETPLGSGCNLRPSAMRTPKTYQVLKSYAKNDKGTFYSATHRYVFKVSALQKMLVDPSSFHGDVRLFDFYAYTTFDLGDITTFKGARCANVLSPVPTKGPDMSNVVYGKQWLTNAANVLALQDKVDEFRTKAIDLINLETLAKRNASRQNSLQIHPPATAFKERKQGVNVLLLVAPEHGKIGHAALRLAKLFVHDIVDKLHVVMVGSSSDRPEGMKATLDTMTDKELEFNGQLLRQVVLRNNDSSTVDTIMDICSSTGASMVVVPSLRLAGAHQDLGALASSLAFCVSRLVTHLHILVVKGNSLGKWTNHPVGGERLPLEAPGLAAMAVLDSTHVTPMVEFITKQLQPARADKLYLAKTNAFETPGQLSMRSRRVFVQARMAVTDALLVEERAYAHAALQELPKAVEAEGTDILVLSVAGELPISKEVEELLKAVRTSVFIFRDKDAYVPHQSSTGFTVVDAVVEPQGYTRPAGQRPSGPRKLT